MPFIFGMLRSSRTRRRSFGILSPRSIARPSSPLPATNNGFETFFRSNARRTIIPSTSTQLGFHPDSSALCIDDLLHHGQSNSGAFDFVARLECLEYAKYSVMILGGDALAVVSNRKFDKRPRIGPCNVDHRVGFPRVLDRVPDKVHEYLLKGDFLRPHGGHVRSDADIDLLRGRHELDHVSDESSRVDILGLRLHSACPRILENSVDQRFQTVNPASKQLHLRFVLAAKFGAEILFDPLGKISDAAKRRLEVVRRHVRELIQLLVAPRKRLDQLLAFSFGILAFRFRSFSIGDVSKDARKRRLPRDVASGYSQLAIEFGPVLSHRGQLEPLANYAFFTRFQIASQAFVMCFAHSLGDD